MNNKVAWDSFLTEAYSYILGLKDSNGTLMYISRRKTGFIGFLVAIVWKQYSWLSEITTSTNEILT